MDQRVPYYIAGTIKMVLIMSPMYPGSDGVVRVATVQTQDEIFKPSVVKLEKLSIPPTDSNVATS